MPSASTETPGRADAGTDRTKRNGHSRRPSLSRAGWTVVVALTAMGLAIALALLHAPLQVARRNGTVVVPQLLAAGTRPATYCQARESVPPGTVALRLSLGAYTGPHVALNIEADGRVVTSGQQSTGWTGNNVEVPVHQTRMPVENAEICATLQTRDETVFVYGRGTTHSTVVREDGRPLPGEMVIEYLRPGRSVWASQLLPIMRRMGLGRADAGTWIAFVAVLLMAAVTVLVARALLEELP